MIISIGGLIFSSVKGTGFDSIQKTFKGEYTELKLVDGAMSQKTGRPLNKLTFSAQWIGLETTDTIKLLDKLLTGFHQASDQDGNNLGQWTCDQFTDNGTDIFGGATVCHKITISLTEYR